MAKIYRAVIREIYFNKSRSFITFLTILVIVAFPIAMFSTAPSITYSIDVNSQDYHLAHLDIRFTNVTTEIVPLINNSIIDCLGWAPERISTRVSSGYKIFHETEWYPVNIVGVNDSKTMDVNEIKLVEGTLDISDNQTVILESFANHLNLSLDDSISLYGETGVQQFTIVGIIRSIEFMSYDFTQEGAIYISEKDLRSIANIPFPFFNNVLVYFSDEVSKDEINDCSDYLHDVFIEAHLPLIIIWQVREISISASLTDILNLTSKYLNSSAIIIMIIAGFVVFIITKRYAFEQRKQTGMLYSFGFSSSTIMKAFLLRTLVIALFAIGVGIVASWFLLKFLSGMLATLWGILDLTSFFSIGILVEVVGITLFISLIFTYLAAKENVSMTPYEALRSKVKEFKPKTKKKPLPIRFPLQLKYAFRNLSRNKLRTTLTLIAFMGSIMLSFSLLSAQTSLSTTQNVYFDTKVKWDVKGLFNTFDYTHAIYDEISQFNSIEHSEPYLEAIVQPDIRSELIVQLRGIVSDSQLIEIDIQEGQDFSGEKAAEVIMSTHIAKKLDVKSGDNFSFWFHTEQVNISIVGLCRAVGSPIAMFIQLPYLEERLGYLPVNGIIASSQNNKSGDLMDEMNTHKDIRLALSKSIFQDRIESIIDIQTIIVKIMMILGFIIAFLAIFSTTFIITIERTREVSLERVFGFSKSQILLQLGLEIAMLTLVALCLGFISGLFLNCYWLSLISDIFFKIESSTTGWDYLITISFSIMTVVISLIPEFQFLGGKNLAQAIEEE